MQQDSAKYHKAICFTFGIFLKTERQFVDENEAVTLPHTCIHDRTFIYDFFFI